jgi:glutamate/aspartate transport system substrate-binding protein
LPDIFKTDDMPEGDIMNLKKLFIATAGAGLMAGSFVTVQAQDLGGTLKKIKDTNTITIGYRESSIPFSFLDDKQQPVGYAIDLCMKIVDTVKADLKLPNLKVAMQPVTSSNRIPLLRNGTIDLECGSTTNSKVRQEQVSFGPSYFVINVTAAVKKSSNINTLADLNGKTISTTSGTTSVPLLKGYKKTENIQVKEIYGKDHAEAFLLMADDRAVAFVMDNILLAGQIANSKRPSDYKILPESLSQEPYSMMLRKDDPQFKALVDKSIGAVMKSGEINKIYAKWFTTPIPPKGLNINFPMTPPIEEAFKNPNDKGV